MDAECTAQTRAEAFLVVHRRHHQARLEPAFKDVLCKKFSFLEQLMQSRFVAYVVKLDSSQAAMGVVSRSI